MPLLFDEEFVSQFATLDRIDSQVQWLCTTEESAGIELRGQLERWFDALPAMTQNTVKSRLRSPDNAQHYGALFELYFHHYLSEHFSRVASENPLGKGAPDFSFTLSNGLDVVFEVVSLIDHQNRLNCKKVEDRLIAMLEKEFGPAGYDLTWEDDMPADLDCKAVVTHIKSAVREAQSSEKSGLVMNLRACGVPGIIKIPPDADDPNVEFHLSGPGLEGYSGKIRSMLQAKRKKYKELKGGKTAFVVCLCTRNSLVNDFDVQQALYGPQAVHLQVTRQEVTPIPGLFAGGGLLARQSADGVFQNTTISAVLFCKMKREGPEFDFEKSLYHNSFGAIQLPHNTFPECREFGVTERSTASLTMGWVCTGDSK